MSAHSSLVNVAICLLLLGPFDALQCDELANQGSIDSFDEIRRYTTIFRVRSNSLDDLFDSFWRRDIGLGLLVVGSLPHQRMALCNQVDHCSVDRVNLSAYLFEGHARHVSIRRPRDRQTEPHDRAPHSPKNTVTC